MIRLISQIGFAAEWLVHMKGRMVSCEWLDNCIRLTNHAETIKQWKPVEEYREMLLQQPDRIRTGSYGASESKRTTLSRRTRRISVSPVLGRFLHTLVGWYHPNRVIELGTGYGMGTLYLGLNNRNTEVITVEGDPFAVHMANAAFRQFHPENIRLIEGEFGDMLPELLKERSIRLMVFIDGNHTRQATLEYFDRLVKDAPCEFLLVLDDIRWSAGMYKAWKTICTHPSTGFVADLYRMGLAFSHHRKPNLICRRWIN